MKLKVPMEEKQLNFNRPLLSVRRGSSTTAPPEINRRVNYNCPPNMSPLPYYRSDLKSGPVRNAGAIPFQWEQTPGKPKDDEAKEQTEIPEQLPRAPNLPPGRVPNQKKKSSDKALKDSPGSSSRSQGENYTASSPDLSSVRVMSEIEAKEKDKGKENEDISSSEDENVTFVDARDTLSRTESFFLNCSVSRVSGLDGGNAEPSWAFSDPQIRDFMMGRFLPAAKAVASETPQFASKKHPVPRERPKPINKVVQNKGSPIYYDVHNVSLHHIHGEEEEDEEEDGGDGYEDREDMSAKLCGLFPRFCLLNPIPGMRDHTQMIPQSRSVRRKPAYSIASMKIENKGQIDKHRGEVKRIAYKNGRTNKATLNGRFGHKTVKSFKEGSTHSFLGLGRGYLGHPEETRDLRIKVDIQKKSFTRLKELLADDVSEGTPSHRTLYIDSEQNSESQNSNSSSSEYSRGRNPSVDYSLHDIHSHCARDEKEVSHPENSEVVEDRLVKDSRKDHNLSLVVKEDSLKSSRPLELAPLLPKSPSESWLSRTLPSIISSKNPASKTYLGNVAFKASSPLDPKHGRVLKPFKGQHMVFYSPMELGPILEN